MWVFSFVLKWTLEIPSHQFDAAPQRFPPEPSWQLEFSFCGNSNVFSPTFSIVASCVGAIYFESCSTHHAKYKTLGCPVSYPPTALLTSQSGGELVSPTLTLGSSGVLLVWLLTRLPTLLVSCLLLCFHLFYSCTVANCILC